MLSRSRLAQLVAFAFVALAPSTAAAWCRSTTCTTVKNRPSWCVRDEVTGCERNGAPLLWRQGCVSFSVQEDGLGAFDWQQLDEEVQRAFDRWTQVDCGGGRKPSISVSSLSPVRCRRTEYNSDGPNANLITRSFGTWPYADNAVAVTVSTFDTSNGLMRDSDIVLRDQGFSLSDLAGTLTHEAGHFLGLDHSYDAGSIMAPARHFGISTEAPTLAADDLAGICAVYPPERSVPACDPEPEPGLGIECGGVAEGGCSQVGNTGDALSVIFALLAATTAAHTARRKLHG